MWHVSTFPMLVYSLIGPPFLSHRQVTGIGELGPPFLTRRQITTNLETGTPIFDRWIQIKVICGSDVLTPTPGNCVHFTISPTNNKIKVDRSLLVSCNSWRPDPKLGVIVHKENTEGPVFCPVTYPWVRKGGIWCPNWG